MSLQSLAHLFKRFARDRRGGMAAIIGFSIIPMIGFIGLGVDTGRGYLIQSRLSTALDAAALAAGAKVEASTADIEADIQMFMDANFPDSLYGAQVDLPTITISADGETIAVTASAQIGTTFMRVLGFNDLHVSAATEVTRKIAGMELSLVMDVTGSMRWDGKMDSMKSAATTLINILYGERETVEDLWVALVPYATIVNAGFAHTDWTTDYNPANFDLIGDYDPDQLSWKGCVLARDTPDDMSDTPPDTLGFQVYTWPDDDVNDWIDGSGDLQLNESDYTQQTTSSAEGPNLSCPTPVLPLTAAKSTVTDAIDDMGPYRRFGTFSNTGLAWGWRTLSPRWEGTWGGDTPNNLPLPYDEPLMNKVIVLLTDGYSQWSGASNDFYTGYGYPDDGNLVPPPVGTSNSRAELNSRLASICTAVKQQGIILYTITFKVGGATSLKNLYQGCASSPDKYFDSPSNSALQATFEAIGKELSNLRLSQ